MNLTVFLRPKKRCGLDEKEKIDIYAPTNGDDDVIVNYVNETEKDNFSL